MKEIKLGGIILFVISLITLFASCSLPSDPDPVKWEFSMVVPIAKEKIDLWTPLDSIVNDMNSESDSGSSIELNGDSVITMIRHDTVHTTMDLSGFFAQSTTSVREVELVGEIAIEGMAIVSIPLVAIPGQTLQDDGTTVAVQVPVDSEQFEYLMLSDTTPELLFHFTHNGVTSIDMISVGFNGVTYENRGSSSINPGMVQNIGVPLENQSIVAGESFFTIQLHYVTPPQPSDFVNVSFSFNDQIIQSGRLSSMVFPDTIVLDVTKELADSIEISSIRFNELEMLCSLTNSLGMEMVMNAYMNRETSRLPLWDNDVQLPVGDTVTHSIMENVTLLPLFDSSEQKSLLEIQFIMMPQKDGSMVDFSAEDSVSVGFSLGSMQFHSLAGVFTNGLEESERASDWELPELIADDMRESVVGKLKTEGAMVTAEFISRFDSTSVIDSVELNIKMNYSYGDSEEEYETNLFSFTEFAGGVTQSLEVDGDKLISYLPENLTSEAVVRIPPGTPFSIVTQNDSLEVPFDIYLDIYLPLHFVSTDSVTIVTDIEQIEMPSDVAPILNALEQPQVQMTVSYKNLTDIDLELFAMMTGNENFALFDTLSSNTFAPGVYDGDSIFYPISGNAFLKIRPGEQDTTLTWTIGAAAFHCIAESDTICMRFRIDIPDSSDMIIDSTAAVEIKTAVSLSGIARSDFMKEFEE